MKKAWKAPDPIQLEITKRDDGATALATASVTFGTDTVQSKARANGFIVKDPTGEAIRVPVPVRTTHVKLMVPGVGEIASRACCKRPDPFDPKAGIELATRRLIKDQRIPRDLHEPVLRALCPWVLAGKSKAKSVKDVRAITTSQS